MRSTFWRLGELQVKVIVLQLGQSDLTSPAGRMLLTMLAAVAEMERDFWSSARSLVWLGER